jgi:hypothetical protein
MKPLLAPIARRRWSCRRPPGRRGGEQHAVLEGAGLALVGVADDVVRVAPGVAARAPLDVAAEARAAAAAQLRSARSRPAGRRGRGRARRQRCARCQAVVEQRVAAADVVLDVEPLGGQSPTGTRRRIRCAISSMRSRRERVIVRPLTSSAGPWSHMPVHDVVSTLTRPSSETLPGSSHSLSHRRLHQRLVAEHAVGDVVGEQDAVLARRAGVQEAVEARRALDCPPGQFSLASVQATGTANPS